MSEAGARVDLVGALAALGHAHRLAAFRLLSARGPAGLPAGAIAAQLAVAPSALSFHLAALVQARLVTSWRVGKQVFYAADQGATEAFLRFLVTDCCGGNPVLCSDLAYALTNEGSAMSTRVFNVLFVCTANSARSIIAESLLRRLGAGRFNAFSAGSQPRGQVNPGAIEVLKAFDHPTDGLRSKSWGEFAAAGAPVMDFVFTVCDDAAGEACPVWPGQPMTAHWGLPDPAGVTDELERRRAFARTYRLLAHRIGIFVNLPVPSLSQLALRNEVTQIGRALPQG